VKGERSLIGGIRLCSGEDVVRNQLVEYLTLSLLGKREVPDRVIGGRCLRKPCKHGGLGPGQLVGTDPEVPTCSSHITPASVPVVDGIEVHLKDLGLRVAHRQLESKPDLLQRGAEPGARRVELLCQLLGDGASAGSPLVCNVASAARAAPSKTFTRTFE